MQPPPAAAKPRLRSSNLTHEQKRLICIHAKQNPAITQTQLGQWAKARFALATTPSQSSISHTLKRKHNFEHMKSEELASKRMRSVKFPDLDIALANWFLYCQARQIKVQGDEIKAKAHLEFVNPAAERVDDDVELTDQDFVDTAVNAMLLGNVAGGGVTGDISRRAARARAAKKIETSGSPYSSSIAQNGAEVPSNDRPQVMVSLRATKSPLDRSLSQQPREDEPQSATATAATSDEEWQTWTASQSRSKTSDDAQALQRVIHLATEMSAEPSTVLDLNRMLFEVTQMQSLSGALRQKLSKDETALQPTGVCRFTFVTPTKHVV
uniref:HTH CENPB-type domain-containing protein n=1 Tax=Globisporangium ultimum (strain ATCC 200006 / CBS 805.95 / DAOM BR144) TaxID=431595 RepID=K3W7I4_GLOUD